MVQIWIFLIVALFIQENATSTTALYVASQNNIPAWMIVVLFFIITSLDIWLGYWLGGSIEKSWLQNSWFQRWIKKHSGWIQKPGREVILILTGLVNFPILNGVLGAWLELPFPLVYITTFIGDAIGFGILWAIAGGALTLNANKWVTISVIIIGATLISYGLEKLLEYHTRTKK